MAPSLMPNLPDALPDDALSFLALQAAERETEQRLAKEELEALAKIEEHERLQTLDRQAFEEHQEMKPSLSSSVGQKKAWS